MFLFQIGFICIINYDNLSVVLSMFNNIQKHADQLLNHGEGSVQLISSSTQLVFVKEKIIYNHP
jgi:hypothetical protein